MLKAAGKTAEKMLVLQHLVFRIVRWKVCQMYQQL